MAQTTTSGPSPAAPDSPSGADVPPLLVAPTGAVPLPQAARLLPISTSSRAESPHQHHLSNDQNTSTLAEVSSHSTCNEFVRVSAQPAGSSLLRGLSSSVVLVDAGALARVGSDPPNAVDEAMPMRDAFGSDDDQSF
jgi:hypothetical protein